MDIKSIAERIKYFRQEFNYSIADMANKLSITEEEYIDCESGIKDFSFNFLRQAAEFFNVDIVELITGESARLSSYSVDKKDTGLEVFRRSGFDYLQLASRFKRRLMQPYVVKVPYIKEHSDDEIYVSGHEGQEFNYVLEGSIKITIDGKTEILEKGDSIYFDSSKPHGMVAIEGSPAKFLAILTKK